MKMRSFLILTITAMLSIFAAGTELSRTVQQKDSQDVLSFSNLTLEIVSTKSEFVPLEPIPIVLTLSNVTTRPVAWRHALSQNHVELFVVNSAGSSKKIDIQKGNMQLIEVSPYPKMFKPGEAENFKPLVTVGLNDILSKPGNYQIQAVIHGANWHEEIRSNLLLIHIAEPEGVNKRAFDYIKSNAGGSDLFAGFDLSERQQMLNTLEGLANNFTASVYGDYASFRLGEFYFFKNEHAKAKEYLDRLAEKTDFVLADKVSDYRTRLKVRPLTN